jgi:cyclophilin family peptidyl-prolyl cis-trans isomerase
MKLTFGICLCAVVLVSGCRSKNAAVSEKRIEEKIMTETKEQAKKGPTRVKLQTTMGDITIELDEEKAPLTTANFLKYVKEGFYDGTIFHRVISKFMIQGGGMTADMGQKVTSAPIKNEGSNGLKNNRGTIAMARTNNPDSATSQFFINLVDNNFLNYAGAARPGYAVFGKVIEGMDVVDKIGAVKTTTKMGAADVPVEPIAIKSAKIVSDK